MFVSNLIILIVRRKEGRDFTIKKHDTIMKYHRAQTERDIAEASEINTNDLQMDDH